MEKDLKKTLLQRKFASIEYIYEMQAQFRAALETLDEALAAAEKQPGLEQDARDWHASDTPRVWRERARRNLKAIDDSITLGIDQYRGGDPDRVRGTCNNIMSLGKDMEGLGWRWWSYLPDEYRERFIKHRGAAMDRASRIAWTLAGAWKVDELLNERITGPIDEQDLLRYLKPEERA